jgi:tRNA pseudouridine38-40 synthase
LSERLFEPVAFAPPAPHEEQRDVEAEEHEPAEAVVRVMMLVAYDGAPFRGFAPQGRPEVPTVGGVLADALGEMAGRPVAIGCAGRTDAGVHAAGQVVHADLPAAGSLLSPDESGELPRLAVALTGQLAPAIAVLRARPAPPGFDARRSALARRYRYDLLETRAPDPLRAATSWHVGAGLDLAAMRIAADGILGEHDFTAFCKGVPGESGPLLRRVLDVGLGRGADALLSFEIEANAFCHHMVRSLVACLVAVGRGRMTAAGLRSLMLDAERGRLGAIAPACGLRLLLVRYPEELVPGGVLTA